MNMENRTESKNFLLPLELLFDSRYASFDVSSKVLFAILLSYAENAKAIVELAQLITLLGEEKVDSILSNADTSAMLEVELPRNGG